MMLLGPKHRSSNKKSYSLPYLRVENAIEKSIHTFTCWLTREL